MIREAKAAYRAAQPATVEYFRTDRYGDWIEEAIPPRSLDSIYHPEELVHGLIEEVQTFLESKDIYAALGIPYRRGYLLAGPPALGSRPSFWRWPHGFSCRFIPFPCAGRRCPVSG